MNTRAEAVFNILAAIFVLFSAMLDPQLTFVPVFVFLIALAIYNLRPLKKAR